MDVPNAKRLRQLEVENSRLRKLLAERDLDIEVLKEANQKNGERTSSKVAGGLRQESRAVPAEGLCAVWSP